MAKKNTISNIKIHYVILIVVIMLPFTCIQALNTPESLILHIKIMDINGHPVRGLEIVLRPGLISSTTFSNVTDDKGETTIVIDSTYTTFYYKIVHPLLGTLYDGKITLNKSLTRLNIIIPYEIFDLRIHVLDEYLNTIDCIGKLYFRDKLVLINKTINGILELNGSRLDNAPLLLGNNIVYKLLLESNNEVIGEVPISRRTSEIILDLYPPRIFSNKTTINYDRQTSLVEFVSLINVTDGVFTDKIREVKAYYEIINAEKGITISSIKAKTSLVKTVCNNASSYRVYKAESRLFGNMFDKETTYRIHIVLKVVDHSGKAAKISYYKYFSLETITQSNTSTITTSPITTTSFSNGYTKTGLVTFSVPEKKEYVEGIPSIYMFYSIAPIISVAIIVYEIVARRKQ